MSFFYLIFNVLYLGGKGAAARNIGIRACRKFGSIIHPFYAKRTQFPESLNECKVNFDKGLWRFSLIWLYEKRTQTKPKRTQSFDYAQDRFIRYAYCVMRIAKRNLKKQSQFAARQI